MNILLVNPPRSEENAILKYAPVEAKHYIHKKLIGPPLGLLTIAAAVPDYDLTVLDMKGEYDLRPGREDLPEMITRYMAESRADIVGVTVIASEFDDAMKIIETAKKCNPDALTVAGGLHAALCPDDFDQTPTDVLCTGMAAQTFRMIVQAHSKGGSLDHISGIRVRRGKALVPTGRPVVPYDAAGKDYVMPDRSHLAPWLKTYKAGNSPDPATYIFTSLGCPYKCTFCSIWPQFSGKYRQRDVESIIDELKGLDLYPIVRFADANTIVNPDFMSRLFDRIAEEGIKKFFIMDIRADTAVKHPALIEKLARNGLKVVITGFESYKNEELERYRKESKAGMIEEAIRIFHDNGIMLRGNYVIPPYYDRDDFAALSDYAGSHKVVYAGYTILTPMPGTVLYRQMEKEIVDFDLRKYNFFNSVCRTKLPLEEFHRQVGRLWLIKKGTEVI